MSEVEPRSPCISVCVLDGQAVSMGRYRPAAEITDWFMATDEQKRETLRLSRERMQASFSVRPT